MLIIAKKVKCIPEFSIFTVFLKNRNIISKMKISKVTDYAALNFKPSSKPSYPGLEKYFCHCVLAMGNTSCFRTRMNFDFFQCKLLNMQTGIGMRDE